MEVSSTHKSEKHKIIDKDNSRILAAIAIAVFVVIFSLFAIKSLYNQSKFNNVVIGKKEDALTQLQVNKKSVEDLRILYEAFIGEQQNVLGGNPTGAGPLDGNNSKLIIDALPDKYDFPALSSSVEKILKSGGYIIQGIGGTDDGISSTPVSSPSTDTAEVTSIEIPYSFSVSSSIDGTYALLKTLEKSIRPIYVNTLTFSATESGIESNITFKTFYAPAKVFEVKTEEVTE